MPEVKKVFLSSTAKDLPEYREAVYRAVQELDDYKCVRMEDFGAQASSPIDHCRKAVGACDIFVGVVGPLHGSSPQGSDASFTELEYYAAIDYKKPRLMFVVPPGFKVQADLIEIELGDKRARQAAFRKRVLDENTAETDFSTPDELARAVVTAVLKLERKAADERRKAVPNPSANVPRTCDREDQEAAFVRYLRLSDTYRPGLPLVCVVPGEEGQNHWSFVRRLCDTRLQKYATARSGEKGATVKLYNQLDWPCADDLGSRQEALTFSLFEEVDRAYDFRGGDYSAESLRGLLEVSLCSVAVFQHHVQAQHWDATAAQLLRWYLSFWDELKADGGHMPQCVVFMNVVYPAARRGGLWSVLRKLRRANPLGLNKRVLRGLHAIGAGPERAVEPKRERDAAHALADAPAHCALALLDELTCVEKKHVTKWLRDNLFSDDEAEIERSAVRILTDARGRLSKCRNMREVETQLNRIHASIVSETA
jgi:hypothetical protein